MGLAQEWLLAGCGQSLDVLNGMSTPVRPPSYQEGTLGRKKR